MFFGLGTLSTFLLHHWSRMDCCVLVLANKKRVADYSYWFVLNILLYYIGIIGMYFCYNSLVTQSSESCYYQFSVHYRKQIFKVYLIMIYYHITTGYPMAFVFQQLISVTDSKLVQVIMTGLLKAFVFKI